MSDTTNHLDVGALCAEHDHDEVYMLLSNYRRRAVLYALYRNDGELDLAELVSLVAAYETDLPADEIDDDVRQSTYISLYQTHLPKLASFGLVEYDTDERRISLTAAARRAVVAPAQMSPPRWNRYYAILLVVGAVAGSLAWGLNGIADWQMVSLFVLSGLGSVVVAHTWSLQQEHEDGSYIALDDLI